MSSSRDAARVPGPRVREQARDAVGLMVFSATVSVGTALALLALTVLTGSVR